MLTMAELFSGIGGWSEAARMAGGITPIWHSEIDKKKIAVYEKRHPNVPNLGDIRDITNPPWADIYTVSFPCIGISSAGKGEGLKNKDSALWFDAERVIGQVRPQYVVIENSAILTHRGLGRILCGLASFGYDAEWTVIQGTAFGIQQRRARLYLVAYAHQERCKGLQPQGQIFRKFRAWEGLCPSGIYPGWATRRDIPQPRTYGTANDIPGGVYRLAGTGDAIIPLIGCYVLECIKKHHSLTTDPAKVGEDIHF